MDVLRGKTTEKVEQFQHQALSTFGIGKDISEWHHEFWKPACQDISEPQWRSLIRQLVVRGFLRVDVEGYGALQLEEACRPILKGQQTLSLRVDEHKLPSKQRSKKAITVLPEHEQLWEALRDCRKRLADENNIPPYVVFHDATLQEMLEQRPMSRMEMLAISGVGENKLDHYGDEFIEVIVAHEEGALTE